MKALLKGLKDTAQKQSTHKTQKKRETHFPLVTYVPLLLIYQTRLLSTPKGVTIKWNIKFQALKKTPLLI